MALMAPVKQPPRKLVLRGSPQRHTDFMEQLERSYVNAVAAAAGCVVSTPLIDEGVDLTLTHKSDKHLLTDKTARLEVQLKATSATTAIHHDSISTSIDGSRFNEFSVSNPTVHKIVVIMHIPKLNEYWVYSRPKGLTIHYCAYWVNLAGQPTTSSKTTTVSAPLNQVFDDISLCQMMTLIGQGGAP